MARGEDGQVREDPNRLTRANSVGWRSVEAIMKIPRRLPFQARKTTIPLVDPEGSPYTEHRDTFSDERTSMCSSRCLLFTITALMSLSMTSCLAPADSVTLQGCGATFPAPLYKRWFLEYYKKNPAVRVNYQAIGSGAGVRQFRGKAGSLRRH